MQLRCLLAQLSVCSILLSLSLIHTHTALVHMTHRAMPGDDPGDEVEGIARNGSRIVLPREVFMSCSAAEGPFIAETLT